MAGMFTDPVVFQRTIVEDPCESGNLAEGSGLVLLVNRFRGQGRLGRIGACCRLINAENTDMIAEILSTGDEIRTGTLVDTNSAYIAQELEGMGVRVSRHLTVGDDLSELAAVLQEIGSRADIAVVTGGLGPTSDDLSAEAAARAAKVSLILDPEALRQIEAFFDRIGRPMGDNNRKQALLPESALRIDNPIGSAPGFQLTIGQCRCFFLPGVPLEMKRMLRESVLPTIDSLIGSGQRPVRMVTTLSSFGYGESMTAEKLTGFEAAFPEIRLGYRARFPEVQIKFYLEGPDRRKLEARSREAAEWVKARMNGRVFSDRGESMPEVIGRLLLERRATLAIAESCTGGLISHWVTNVAGSSRYFLSAAVTYANEAKIRLLGVSPETIFQHGAVSEAVVREMADGVRRMSGADYGLATSGIAGPDGGTPEKPVGLVWIGVSTPEGTSARSFQFRYANREANKQMFAMTALEMLRRTLCQIS